MIIYYFSWVFGSLLDAHDQALVYLTAPDGGRVPITAIGMMVALAAVFGVLCWVDTYQKFSQALGLFWLINILAWQYLEKMGTDLLFGYIQA
jgi:hypothetical protein